MDIRKIKKLIELVEESGVSELEITEGEESVRINRYSAQAAPILFSMLRNRHLRRRLRQHRQSSDSCGSSSEGNIRSYRSLTHGRNVLRSAFT